MRYLYYAAEPPNVPDIIGCPKSLFLRRFFPLPVVKCCETSPSAAPVNLVLLFCESGKENGRDGANNRSRGRREWPPGK